MSHPDALSRWSVVALWLLGIFTAVAVVGYATFGLNPGLLARFPATVSFYAISFSFFAQAHVLLGAVVLIFYLTRQVRTKWLAAFVAVYVLSLASELGGTSYGIPFGHYDYTGLLGAMWLDRVPWLIPVSWFAMAVPSYALAVAAFPGRSPALRIAFASYLLVAWDLALDPAMSYLTSYWLWEDAGLYYGMPAVNLVGWAVTAIVIMGVMYALGAESWLRQVSARWMAAYYLLIVAMPFGMILFAGLWWAVAATVASLALAWFVASREKDRNVTAAQGREPVDLDATRTEVLSAQTVDHFFGHHSRSFSFAARWFPEKQRRLVACLYMFCRTVDDLVDGGAMVPDAIDSELDRWKEKAREAFDGGTSGVSWLDEVMHASADSGLPFHIVEDLIAGVRSDNGSVRIRTWEELDEYTYRVASVVGIWMCHLFGVRDPALLDRAADMGRAMQMTNILRDVGEDLMRDRIYLPETLLAEFGISAHQLHAMANGDAITHEYRGCLTVFMRRADDLYHGAWSVLPVLPPSFGRATAVASEVYRAIHVDIRANGFDNLTRRAHTSTLRKVTLASTSMLRLSAMKLRLRVASAREVSHRTLRLPGRAARAVARYVTGIVSAILVPVAATAAFTSTADGHHETVTRLWEDESAVVDSSVLEQLRAIVSLDGAGPEMLERGILLADRLPESPLSAAYRAALTGMSASGSACAANRIRRVLFALEDLDRLIDRQDDLLEIRFLRLRTSQTLPFVTEDRPSVASDLSMLEKAVVSSGASLPASLMPAVSDLIASLRPSARLAFLSNR